MTNQIKIKANLVDKVMKKMLWWITIKITVKIFNKKSFTNKINTTADTLKNKMMISHINEYFLETQIHILIKIIEMLMTMTILYKR